MENLSTCAQSPPTEKKKEYDSKEEENDVEDYTHQKALKFRDIRDMADYGRLHWLAMAQDIYLANTISNNITKPQEKKETKK
jgi:hypothetical protein